MNANLEEYKKKFVQKFELTIKKNYVIEEENQELTRKYSRSDKEARQILKEYKVESESNELGFHSYRFYKEEAIEISDSEISEYISIKMLNYTIAMQESQNIMKEHQNTMKNIMIFWFITTIISLIGSIYAIVKIGEVFSRLGY